LGETVLQLEAQFEHLSGHTMAALKDELQLIDMQKLDDITKQFEDLDKTAQKTLDNLKVKVSPLSLDSAITKPWTMPKKIFKTSPTKYTNSKQPGTLAALARC
jgi:hypothetical protein